MMNKLASLRHLPSKKISAAAFVSSNAAPSHHQVIQSFHDEFWTAFAARQLKADLVHQFKKDLAVEPLPSSSNPIILHQPTDAEDTNDTALRQLARNDLFKHAHMVASSRCMTRGAGILSRDYSLAVKAGHRSNELQVPEIPTLIDIATARKYREDMHQKYWEAHRSRQDKTTLSRSSSSNAKHLSPPTPRLSAAANRPLPSCLKEVYLEFGLHEYSSQLKVRNMHPRAIAITEASPPHKIVDVNKEWVSLCGFSRKEAIGKTFKALLQGPDTDLSVAKTLVSSLLQDQAESEAVLTNYRSDGSPFRNHIRVGPIKNDTGQTTHFVGVFKKLSGDYEFSNESDEVFANM